jgi:hypothetical protein
MTALEIPRNESATELPCRLCGAAARFIFRQTVLRRWDAGYYQCTGCDLIQTSEPVWLGEAYTSAIAAMDTGAIERNRLTSELTHAIAWALGVKAEARCLDYGGGHGVFTRMMRDWGYNFWLYDRYAENIFARGFEAEGGEHFALVTAFEVLEHLADVRGELNKLFAGRPDAVLVSTQLHREDKAGWWYYAPETGQHVAFYSSRTMRHIAERFGYTAAGSRAYTLFVRRDAEISRWRIRLAQRLAAKSKGNATHAWVRGVLRFAPKLPPRILSDNEAVKLMRL